jgi:hypothetical protein
VEFTPNYVTIYDMHVRSKIVVGEVNHRSHLYTIRNFTAKFDSYLLLTHFNNDSRLWHKSFGHLKLKHVQQLNQ